jgi:hypothetical protein
VYSNSSVGPYAGSWTWFDAEIWRPLPTINANSLKVGSSISSSAQIEPMMVSPSSETLEAAGYLRVHPPSKPGCSVEDNASAWLVQRNKRADNTARRHIVVWTDTNEIGYDCQEDSGQEDISDSSGLSLSTLSTFIRNVHEDEQTVEGVSDPSLCETHGCGSGDEFVSNLQPGDRIAIIARAKVSFIQLIMSWFQTRTKQYLGWCNRIHGNMSVDIVYSIA